MWRRLAGMDWRGLFGDQVALVHRELTGCADAVAISTGPQVAVRGLASGFNHGSGLTIGCSQSVANRGQDQAVKFVVAYKPDLGPASVADPVRGLDERFKGRCVELPHLSYQVARHETLRVRQEQQGFTRRCKLIVTEVQRSASDIEF